MPSHSFYLASLRFILLVSHGAVFAFLSVPFIALLFWGIDGFLRLFRAAAMEKALLPRRFCRSKVDPRGPTTDTTCAICLGSYEEGDGVVRLRCGHCFHDACARPWIVARNTCPFCAGAVLEEDACEHCHALCLAHGIDEEDAGPECVACCGANCVYQPLREDTSVFLAIVASPAFLSAWVFCIALHVLVILRTEHELRVVQAGYP